MEKFDVYKDLAAYWRLRAECKDVVRRFFADRGYIELDTPTIVVSPGTEVYLQYFATDWRDFRDCSHKLYLRSSPELHMKQALGLGFTHIYQLAPCFRNGGELAHFHHPEFTMLEWYEVGLGFDQLMEQTLGLVRSVFDKIFEVRSKFPSTFAGQNHLEKFIDLPVQKISVYDAFREFAGIELVDGDKELARAAKHQGVISVRDDDDFETAYFKILLERIEPNLASLGIIFLHDYPPSQAALAKVVDGRAQRFELYINGVEICNAFDELINYRDNAARLEESETRRREAGLESIPRDPDYSAAIERGIPACSGNALGFERLLAVLLGEKNLSRLIPFRLGSPWKQHLD